MYHNTWRPTIRDLHKPTPMKANAWGRRATHEQKLPPTTEEHRFDLHSFGEMEGESDEPNAKKKTIYIRQRGHTNREQPGATYVLGSVKKASGQNFVGGCLTRAQHHTIALMLPGCCST